MVLIKGIVFLWICCYLNFILNTVLALDGPIARIKDSEIVGNFKDVAFRDGTKKAKLFLGIPYAKPPVGEYRFKKPESLTSLPSVVKATEFKAACLQVPREVFPFDIIPEKQSEDCLFLNVFVPEEKPDKGQGHAVMVYIHGGGFILGAGDVRAEYLATSGNVIVVSINYRLGVFGFLGTGDKNAPGNLGLWDQHLAFQWIHDNIAAFGGDNTRVTIFGESAGSISVIHQALFPPNKGLFQRGIAESGTPGMKFLFQYKALDIAKRFAESIDCNKGDSKEIVSCLRSKSAKEIVDKQNELYLGGTRLDKLGFAPYLDNDFIKLDGLNVVDLKENEHSDVLKFYRSLDMINGVNSAEGLIMFDQQHIPVVENPETFMPTRQQMDAEAIPTVLDNHYGKLDGVPLQMVKALYTDWSNPDCPETMRHQLMKLNGDLLFVVPLVQFSRLHVNSSEDVNSYIYYLNAVPSKPVLSRPSWAVGANHADDLSYVFHFRLMTDKEVTVTDWEYELSMDVMRYWTNFAKTGNPNKPEAVKATWSKYDLKEQSYLGIDKNLSEENAKKYFYAEEAEFWLKTLPDIKKALKNPSGDLYTAQGACSADGECESP